MNLYNVIKIFEMFNYLSLIVILSVFSLYAKAQDEYSLKCSALYPKDLKEVWSAHPSLLENVKKLQRIQGYTYNNSQIAALALIRPSSAYNLTKYIEKLEFLGALYLKVIISELYMNLYPEWQEKALTDGVYRVLNSRFLRHLSQEIGIYDLIIKKDSYINYKSSSYAMKAIVAALWIDGGKDKASQWVQKILSQNVGELRQLQNTKKPFFNMCKLADSCDTFGLAKMWNQFPSLYSRILKLQEMQNYQYTNLSLPALALIHPEAREFLGISNQTLEFLGDSYLNLIIAELCINEYPDWTKGQISQLQTHIMSNIFLAEVGSEIGLDSLILYARKHDLEFKYIADAYEAAIAVLWLTAGREKTYDWVQRLFKARDHDYLITMTNATEGFQKWAKNTFGIDPDYEIQEFTKDQVTYFIGNVFLGDVFIAEAKALNSKQALLLSARKALTMALEGRIIPEE